MHGNRCSGWLILFFAALLISVVHTPSWSQVFMQPYSYGYEEVRPDPYAWLDAAPSDPLSPPGTCQGRPQELHSMCLSTANFAGILPQIPNFQLGYSYTWAGADTTQGLLNFDYLIPKTVNRKDVLFGQAHGQFEDVSALLGGSRDPNMQILVGGGYRKRLGVNAMVGLNGFYTTARLSRDWYSSGIAGLEMAWVSPRDAVLMLNCNYYGNIFADATGILTSYRGQTGDFKIEASYEQPILRRAVDFKIRGSSYRLDRGGDAYGWTAGAELTTRNRILNLRYEVGHDRITDTYHSVGVFVTVGLRLERLFRLSSPFAAL